MERMKAIQVAAKGEPMVLVEIPVPQPGEGQVLLKVEACGICHGDSKVIEGAASSYPRIPGHEVVGIVEKLGTGVTKWKVGQRVGIGWHGGHGHTTALTTDGGYAEYMVAYEDGLISIPNEITPEEAAPLLCAGETTFSALHNSGAKMGDLVAVSGIGGLGVNGELIIAAVDDTPLDWSAMDFLNGPNTVKGTFTDIKEMEAAVRFSILTDVRPMIEVFPLEQAREAYEKMMAAKTHFRAVLRISD